MVLEVLLLININQRNKKHFNHLNYKTKGRPLLIDKKVELVNKMSDKMQKRSINQLLVRINFKKFILYRYWDLCRSLALVSLVTKS